MSELVRNLGINGTLLVAQAINFFVVFAVLKLFAFDPIAALLKKRRENIARGLVAQREAEERLMEIGGLRQQTLKQAREEALALVSDAEKAIKERQEAALAEARVRGDRITEDAKRLIREERAQMQEAMAEDTKRLIRESVIQTLGMMPPEERDKRLVEKALQALKNV
ncbi:MAG: ATP synthase F0 subunit B [Candidatus Sungbacteria bacterium]|nr:ATP synthase F0 subunit B [Candidatus Sungbacteria bacterium]